MNLLIHVNYIFNLYVLFFLLNIEEFIDIISNNLVFHFSFEKIPFLDFLSMFCFLKLIPDHV